MKPTLRALFFPLLSAVFLIPHPAMANDQLIARAGEYFVMLQTDDQTGIAVLGKSRRKGEPEILARSEDIVPQIEKLVPAHEALELATQLARDEIKENGGPEKMQAAVDAHVKRDGAKFYSDLTPLSLAAYKANGVIIPRAK